MASVPVAPDKNWPSPVYGWYVVGLLALANTLSFVDRAILNLLVVPIKADLGLSDTQISLLQGFAFALFYALLGLPIARIADSGSRKALISVGVAFWSLMTSLCGVTKSFWQIFLTRVGVGVGEATLMPSAYSLLSDCFPPARLALPMGIFLSGTIIGTGLAFVGGAAAIQFIEALGTVDLPLLGDLPPWRLTFLVIGALGIFVVALMLTMREPVRRGRDGEGAGQSSSIPVPEVWGHYRQNWRIYTYVFLGYGAYLACGSGIAAWTPTFYIRSYGASASEAGYFLGVVTIVGGVAGALLGGGLSDRLEQRGDLNAKLRVSLICSLGIIPAGVLAPFMPNIWLAVGITSFSMFFSLAGSGPVGSFVQVITPNRMRAQFGAAYQFIISLIGMGLGPTVIALFTDYAFRDELMVRYSISATVALFGSISLCFFWVAFRHYPGVRGQLELRESRRG